MKILLLLVLLAGCASEETRTCLVSMNDQCVAYDFSSSRNENPLGNTKQLIEDERHG